MKFLIKLHSNILRLNFYFAYSKCGSHQPPHSNTRHHHYPVLLLRNSTQMHTSKAAQSTRQTNTRSFVSFESRKTEQTPASPFGTVPAVVAVAGVGGSTLIIPQNPSQMSQSLEGRWAGAPPLCRTAMMLAALQTCWV